MTTPSAAGDPNRWVSLVDEQDIIELPEQHVREVCLLTLEMEDVEGGVEIALVDDSTIADLNERYLKEPGPTDVITFPLVEDAESAGPGSVPVGFVPSLGEVVVSTETARRQAPEFLGDAKRETLLYVIHGVLHLLGYDDKNPATRARMEERQIEVLRGWEARK